MSYPALTAAIADQHRRDLIAQADAYRLARAARNSCPPRPGRSPRPRRLAGPVRAIRHAVTATAAATAAALLMMTPAGAATNHLFAHRAPGHHFVHFSPVHFVSVHSWSASWGKSGVKWA